MKSMEYRAIDPCIMNATGKPALTVGKVYTALNTSPKLLIIKNDLNSTHHFGGEDIPRFFKLVVDTSNIEVYETIRN